MGLGSKLLQRGAEIADEAGLETYLDASKMGQSLYEKFGFVAQKQKDEKAVSTPMVRPAKEKED